MSLTLILWLILFGILTFLAVFKAPVWGVSLYLMVYLLYPEQWWWGKIVGDLRWSYISGLILLTAVCINHVRHNMVVDRNNGNNVKDFEKRNSDLFFKEHSINVIAILLILNYLFVHFILAGGTEVSFEKFNLNIKFIILFFLIKYAVQTKRDYFIVIFTITILLGYLGYQITENNVGEMVHGRLEDIPIPGAKTANFFVSMIIVFLPCIGALFFVMNSKYIKLLILFTIPFAANIVFLCNSRGAYLGFITAGFFLLFTVRRQEKKYIYIALACSMLLVFLLAEDQSISNRFQSIFVNVEEMDRSSTLRLTFWRAGLDMLSDYPLGTGGNGFKYVHGMDYTTKYGITQHRAVHNSYLSIATSWGIQGLLLHVTLIFLVLYKARSFLKNKTDIENIYKDSFILKAMICGVVGLFVSSIFSNTLDEEWLFWMLALICAYIKILYTQKEIYQA